MSSTLGARACHDAFRSLFLLVQLLLLRETCAFYALAVRFSEFILGALYMTGLACSMPAFSSKVDRDEPGMLQPWTPEPTGLWGGVRLTHPF